MKTKFSTEEYSQIKRAWDEKRKPFESDEERNKRECEEILEEVREQREKMVIE